MANRIPEAEPKLADILTGIVSDLQELVQHQLALFRSEVRHDLRRTREAATLLAVGLGIALLGGLLLAHTLVHLLAWLLPAWPMWSHYCIVAALLLASGAALAYRGKAQLDSFNPLPDETVEAVKENVQWLMKPKNPT
jgi:hypothetical protein